MGYAVGPGQKAFVGFDKTIVSCKPLYAQLHCVILLPWSPY